MKPNCDRLPISFTQKICSRDEEAESLCLRIRGALASAGLGGLVFRVELLARECLANAINHGNRRNVDKAVELRFALGRKWIRLEVSDEGPGFAWRREQGRMGSTAATSGRGVELYSLYAERVGFNRSGNRVKLWVSRDQI